MNCANCREGNQPRAWATVELMPDKVMFESSKISDGPDAYIVADGAYNLSDMV
jgi:hypothetical protein